MPTDNRELARSSVGVEKSAIVLYSRRVVESLRAALSRENWESILTLISSHQKTWAHRRCLWPRALELLMWLFWVWEVLEIFNLMLSVRRGRVETWYNLKPDTKVILQQNTEILSSSPWFTSIPPLFSLLTCECRLTLSRWWWSVIFIPWCVRVRLVGQQKQKKTSPCSHDDTCCTTISRAY